MLGSAGSGCFQHHAACRRRCGRQDVRGLCSRHDCVRPFLSGSLLLYISGWPVSAESPDGVCGEVTEPRVGPLEPLSPSCELETWGAWTQRAPLVARGTSVVFGVASVPLRAPASACTRERSDAWSDLWGQTLAAGTLSPCSRPGLGGVGALCILHSLPFSCWI